MGLSLTVVKFRFLSSFLNMSVLKFKVFCLYNKQSVDVLIKQLPQTQAIVAAVPEFCDH